MYNIKIFDIRRCDNCDPFSMSLTIGSDRKAGMKKCEQIFHGNPDSDIMLLGDFADP